MEQQMNSEGIAAAQAWSLPETEVLGRMTAAHDDDASYVVATLVDVEGSAYRRPGAKMLISDTESVGSVTAGCLTSTVNDVSQSVRESGVARTERFDLTDDEEWGVGLGCNGVITLLLEPLDDRFSPLLHNYAEGEEGVALVVLDADETPTLDRGHREFNNEPTVPENSTLPDWLQEGLAGHIRERVAADNPGTVTVTGPSRDSASVYIEPVLQPPQVYIFGGGNDVHPVSELLTKAGFKVTVISFRGGRANSSSFPHADRVVSASAPRIDDSISLDPEGYAVVMSHNLVDDRLAVESLLDASIQYIGIMGPRERFDKIHESLTNDGQQLSEVDRERLYAPIGLDLGGGDPYQIATSIVSEVLAVHNDCSSGHLRDRAGPIHDRPGVDR